jgi:hypothetical protein
LTQPREATHRGRIPLEAITWPADYSPACPACAHPTTGLEEQYARVRGIREPVVVALAQPCGCLIDNHAATLQAGVTTMGQHQFSSSGQWAVS